MPTACGTVWTFSSAGQIIFGLGAAQLGDVVRRMGLKRVLVVTNARLIEAGLYDEARAALGGAATLDVFAGGEPEPTLRAAEACIAQPARVPARWDRGAGGRQQHGPGEDDGDGAGARRRAGEYLGEDRIPGPILPLVCLPTTSGTGSEVSASSVFTDEENHIKAGAMSNYLRPRVAVVDPRLTLSCPRKVTADSGIDAMTHAIEAFTAVDNAMFPLPPGERSLYQGRIRWAIRWPSRRSR